MRAIAALACSAVMLASAGRTSTFALRATADEPGATRENMQRIRIVAMGDSTTAGTPGWMSPIEFPPNGRGNDRSQYAFWLMQAHPDWDVLNRGVNGERSDEIRARFERDVIDAQPRAVVLIAGVNDVYQGRPASHVMEQLRAMYARAEQARIKVVAGSIVSFNTATPDQNARMREINDWIRRQAEADPNVEFADTRAAAASPADPDRLFASPDDLHPSPEGYRRMADAIKPALERVLR